METIVQNIIEQPESLREVYEHQIGAGRAALEKAAYTLHQARHIVLCGMGSSYYACIPLYYYLAKKGIVTTLADASELLHYTSPAFANSAVVLVSRSGETVEAVKLLPKLRELNAAVVGVTNEPESTLAKETDASILVHSRSDELVAILTYTGSLLALMMLGFALTEVEMKPVRNEVESFLQTDWKAHIREWLEGDLIDCKNWTDTTRLYLLGRGGSLASVMEGALMFHEAAKTPAVSMNTGMFRHGPVEVVNSDYRAFLFLPRDETYEINLHLALDIAHMGGHIYAIGSNTFDRPLIPLRYPALPGWLSPIAEIFPVQAASVRLAKAKGIPLGKFKYATLVTRSETGFEM